MILLRHLRYSDEFQAGFPGICITNKDLHAVTVVGSVTPLRDGHDPVLDYIHLDKFANEWGTCSEFCCEAFLDSLATNKQFTTLPVLHANGVLRI